MSWFLFVQEFLQELFNDDWQMMRDMRDCLFAEMT
jgi:hypothetical protein